MADDRDFRTSPTGFEAARLEGAQPEAEIGRKNRKGCDIGYALAANSCEGVNSVETCTITALDAITAFAVSNPNGASQNRRFFRV